jgi:hypothetical protein
LRNEKEHHGLAKMTKDSNNCKSHSGAVTEGISHEHFAWEFVVFEEG